MSRCRALPTASILVFVFSMALTLILGSLRTPTSSEDVGDRRLITCKTTTKKTTELSKHPVVVVPGSGGNQLEARLSGEHKESGIACWLTRRWGRWFPLWLDPIILFAPLTRCFAQRMTIYYHADIDDYRNASGVETRVPYFGSTRSLLYLNPNLKFLTGYMAKLVAALKKELGYEDGETLYGAPYDFRYGLAGSGHPSKVGEQYLLDLKFLIESAAAAANDQPVVLVAHSLGCLFAHQLLLRNPPSWRRRFVKHLIALSPPWGGTIQQMITFASGYTLGAPFVDPLIIRGEQRSSESNLWLLPTPMVFGDNPLALSVNRSYSAMEMEDFLRDIGFAEGIAPYTTRVLPMVWRPLESPGVPVTCVIGTGINTPEKLVYGKGGFDEQPEIIYGDGDGTVNLRSLLAAEKWWSGGGDEAPLNVIRVPGVSHSAVLTDSAAVKEIIDEISEINSSLNQSLYTGHKCT